MQITQVRAVGARKKFILKYKFLIWGVKIHEGGA
jgi:hypothetical protein